MFSEEKDFIEKISEIIQYAEKKKLSMVVFLEDDETCFSAFKNINEQNSFDIAESLKAVLFSNIPPFNIDYWFDMGVSLN